jgi:hypothetical protein
MKPMRFPRRFPWLIVVLIAVGPVLFSVPLTIWYSFTMPPLERYYYDAYFNSTALKNSPSATTEVQWIFKTAPGRTEELAGPADIVSGSSRDQEHLAVPMKLSSAARDAGWRSLEQGSKERVNAAELQRYLQASFYDGEGFWHLLLQPALWGVAFILALLALRIWFQGQSKQEERHGRRTKGPELLSALRWNRKTKADGIQLHLRWDNPRLDRFNKLLPGWASPSFRIPRNLEASHVLLMGDTGSGKTTTLAVVREGAVAQGYTVEGFAPTSRAAYKLGEAGIETSTLQRHLARGEQPDTGEKRLYVLDESSLASTRQMHDFVTRLHPNDRVLLVGDTRQHEAVEAGRPFAQLQEAGMRTVKLDEIVRQRDPELKQAVEQLAHGQVGAAVESLDRQGRVHEVKGHEERISAIAREYAKSPESTLVVSPDNRSRAEINQKIHDELQSRGIVSREEHSVQTLVPRQELTGADRSWAQQYQVNDIVRYSRSSQETGIQKGEYTRVVNVNAQANTLTVVRGNGEQTTYDPRRQVGVSVYREQEKSFSVGDRVQFTAPSQELKIANRELGTVEGIAQDGTMRLKLDNERSMSFDPQRHPHLDHGYAVTSYSSQGQTADRVLINVDTELGAKDLLNNRMAYVSVSRGAHDAQIFTNDREKLPVALGHDVSQQSAHAPQVGIEKGVTPQQDLGEKMKPQSVPEQEISHGFSIG